MKICPKCNASLPDESVFCFDCGESVENVLPVQEASVPTMDPVTPPAPDESYYQQQYEQPQEQYAQEQYPQDQYGQEQYYDDQYSQDQYAQQTYYPDQTYTDTGASVEQQSYAPTMDEVQPVIDNTQPTMDEVQPVIEQNYYQNNGGYYNSPPPGYARPANGYYSQPQQGMNAPYQGYPPQQGQQPQPQDPANMNSNPDYINPAAPNMPGVVPGKGGSSLIVPIILIILILAVIFIDVFWLFRDQIWGKDDSSSTNAVTCVTAINDQTIE